MTMPHLMNCAHSPDGWCLDCVAKLAADNDHLRRSLAAFPHTKDGVYVTSKTELYCPRGHECHNLATRAYCTAGECWDDGYQSDSGSGTTYKFEECTALSPTPANPEAPNAER